jgi:hypothetical protein
MIRSFLVNKSETVDVLAPLIMTPYHLTLENIKKALNNHLLMLKDDILVFIEYPYVDKVYRDSYYNYFSTKHHQYERDCARLTFFEKGVTDEHFRKHNLRDELQRNILGFIVIRPTIPKLIGRSIISPKALKRNNFEICLCKVNVSVNGVKLNSYGFPHASQDNETMTCAETTVWELMEYFGNNYPEYKPVLPSKIHKVLSNISYERQIPSHGLTLDQISFALKEFEFGTKIYANMLPAELQRNLDYYIESGVPVIAALESGDLGHAVLIIGHEKKDINYLPPGHIPESVLLKNGTTLKIIDSADIIKKYIIMDDNFPPYQTALFDKPGEYYAKPPHNNYKIKGITVPLYSKVYTDAPEAKKLTIEILKNFELQFPSNEVILRLYLISSRSLKHEIALKDDFNSDNKELLLNTSMPKFVWVIEFSTKDQFEKDEAFGLIVLNSTDNSIYTAINIIIFPDKAIVDQNGEHLIYDINSTKFVSLKNNLKGEWSSWQN